ncbi:MAG: type II toxin-antitoxin system VapC family toxin [Sphingopyxis sp.]|nr:type II toxin-antitoxin system VapC family toxin [Sphingopyxis sp.]
MADRYLLDTHTLVWWAFGSARLSNAARELIEDPDNVMLFSPVTAMEIATKVRIGKFDDARVLATNFNRQMTEHGLTELPVTSQHAEMAGGFASTNNDPWDRILAAQARCEDIVLITNDSKMDDFQVRIFW